MPNLTGGKRYKSKKNASEGPAFVERMTDQLYARVLKTLGDRNILVYSNDNKIRLCHIRGSIRKDMWIGVGDIVLISIRDLKETETYERGDIIYKYSTEHYSKLKNDEYMNDKLFLMLEKYTPEDLKSMEGVVGTATLDLGDTEELFDYGITKDEIDGI